MIQWWTRSIQRTRTDPLAANVTITTGYGSVTLESDGANWMTV